MAVLLARRMERALPRLPPVLNGTTIFFAKHVLSCQAISQAENGELQIDNSDGGALLIALLPCDRFAAICRRTVDNAEPLRMVLADSTSVIVCERDLTVCWLHEEHFTWYSVKLQTTEDFWMLTRCFGMNACHIGPRPVPAACKLTVLVDKFDACLAYGAFGESLVHVRRFCHCVLVYLRLALNCYLLLCGMIVSYELVLSLMEDGPRV